MLRGCKVEILRYTEILMMLKTKGKSYLRRGQLHGLLPNFSEDDLFKQDALPATFEQCRLNAVPGLAIFIPLDDLPRIGTSLAWSTSLVV